MNTFVAVFSCLLAASQASVLPLAAPLAAPLAGTTLVRAPAHDSASFTHHRLGGNFAYAVGTAEAFAQVTPKLGVQRVAVAEHTHVHTPAVAAPAYAAAPAIAAAPIAAHGLAGGYGLGLAGGYGLPAGGLALGALPAVH